MVHLGRPSRHIWKEIRFEFTCEKSTNVFTHKLNWKMLSGGSENRRNCINFQFRMSIRRCEKDFFFQFSICTRERNENRSLKWLWWILHISMLFQSGMVKRTVSKRWECDKLKLGKIYAVVLPDKINFSLPGTTQILRNSNMEIISHPLVKYFDRMLLSYWAYIPAWMEPCIFHKSRWILHFQLGCRSKLL